MLHSFSMVVVFQAQIPIDKTKLGEFKQNMNQKVEYFHFHFQTLTNVSVSTNNPNSRQSYGCGRKILAGFHRKYFDWSSFSFEPNLNFEQPSYFALNQEHLCYFEQFHSSR